MKVDYKRGKLSIHTSLEVADILCTGQASYFVNLLGLEQKFDADFTATVETISARIGVSLNAKSAQIDEFEYEVFSDAKTEVDVKGMSIFNAVVSGIADGVINNEVKPTVKKYLRDILEEELKKFKGFDSLFGLSDTANNIKDEL